MDKIKKLIFVLLGCLFFNANAKVDSDFWTDNDYRVIHSNLKKVKGGVPYLDWKVMLQAKNDADPTYYLVARYYTFSTNDVSFDKGHNILIRLNNEDVITSPISYPAKPTTTTGTVNYHHASTQLEDRYPAWLFSFDQLQKMVNIGIKKIRVEHSGGYYDYNLNESESKKVSKDLQGLIDDVNAQFIKEPPIRKPMKDDTF